MIFKNIKKEFEYILWLRERINKLNFGVSRKVKTDGTKDFALLARKLNSYQREFRLVLDELYSLLKNDDLPTKTDYMRQESGTLSIRSSYCDWQKAKTSKDKAANERASNGRTQKQRRMRI
jgi:hypothetical protein